MQYNQNKQDIQVLKDAILLHFNLTFKGLQCLEHSSIKIQLNKQTGAYYVRNYNPANGVLIPNTGLDVLGIQYLRNGGAMPPTTTAPTTKPTTKTKTTAENKVSCKYTPICDSLAVLSYFSEKGGISIETLIKYDVRAVLSINGTKQTAISYGGEKVRTFPEKGFCKTGAAAVASYCFGLSQAIEGGAANIIITGGEDDALCINQNAGGGVFAVALWSEIIPPNKQLIEILKASGAALWVLYDNDLTGAAEGEKIAKILGAVNLSETFYKGETAKDICELYKMFAARGGAAYAAKQVSIKVLSSLVRIEDRPKQESDIFSIALQGVTNVDFNQYLSEPIPLTIVLNAIKNDKRLIIQSPAGTGKSYSLKDVIEAQKGTFDKVIILTPTKAITQQLCNTIGGDCLGLWGKLTNEDKAMINHSFSIVSTFDKVSKLIKIGGVNLDKTLIVVDEFHQLINDFGYRNQELFRALFNIVLNAPNVVLMSATPNFLFASKAIDQFNFKLFQFYPKTTNKIFVTPILHSSTKNDMIAECRDFAARFKGGGVHCVKMDKNNALKAMQGKTGGEHLTSQKELCKIESYQAIMENGGKDFFKGKNDILYYTTLLEAGVSFTFNVLCVSLLDVKAVSKLVQLSTRPRLQSNGANSVVNVHWFIKESKAAVAEFDTVKKFGELAAKAAETIKKNKTGGAAAVGKVGTDRNIFITSEGGKDSIDYQSIMLNLFEIETANTTIETMKAKLQILDPRFEFLPTINTDVQNIEIKQDLMEAKQAEKEGAAAFLQLIESDFKGALSALAYKSKSPENKELFRELLGVIDRELAIKTIEENKEAFASKAAAQTIQAIKQLTYAANLESEPVSISDIAAAIKESSFDELKNICDRILIKARAAAYRKGTLNTSEKAQMIIYKDIINALDNVRDNVTKGKYKEHGGATAEQLLKIVNSKISNGGGVTVTQKGLKSYISKLYKVEIKVKKIDTKETKKRKNLTIYIPKERL
jgi:hypothetical protein